MYYLCWVSDNLVSILRKPTPRTYRNVEDRSVIGMGDIAEHVFLTKLEVSKSYQEHESL